jgi:ankyrin repeat protein
MMKMVFLWGLKGLSPKMMVQLPFGFGFETAMMYHCNANRKITHTDQCALYVISEAPLEQLLAQHIFSAFMWAVAPSVPIDRIDADSTRVTAKDNLTFASCENIHLAELANSIQQFGLGSREDALLCMVPPLSCNNKLPVNVSVNFIRQQTRDLEKTGKWDVVIDQHIDLFKFCCRFGLQYDSTHRSAAALADLSQKINVTLSLWQSHKYQEKKIKWLSTLRQKLLRSLRSLDEEFAGHLIRMMQTSYKIDSDLESLRRGQLTTIENAHKFFRHSEFLTRFHALIKQYAGQSRRELEEVFKGTLQEVNSTDVFNRTALHYATNSGDEQLVRYLLEWKANIRAIDIQDNTPLHTACDAGREGVIRMLLEFKEATADIDAYINAEGRYGSSPLHLAARAGDLKSVRLLILKGAQIDIYDHSRRTPLHWAAFHGRDTIVELLLRHHASTTARDEHGRPPLLSAIYGYNGLKPRNDRTIKKMLEWRVDTNLADNDGKMSLHLVAEANSSDLAKLLLRLENGRKPNINALDNHGRSPLHYASIAGHRDMCITLLDFDADVIIEDNEGRTPFDLATRYKHKEVVEIMVSKLFMIIWAGTSDKSTRDILRASIDKERYDIVPPFLKALKLPSPSKGDSFEESILRKSARIETETIVDILVTLILLYGLKPSNTAEIAARELLWIKRAIPSFALIDRTLEFRSAQALTIFNVYQTLWTKFSTTLDQQVAQRLCARILDDGAFWILSSAVNQEGVSVSERDEDIPYVSVDVTGGSMCPVRKIKFVMRSHDKGTVSIACRRNIQIACLINNTRLGRPDESGLLGDYTGSYTWFEAGLSTAKDRQRSSAGDETRKRATRTSGKHPSTKNETTSVRHVIQKNERASSFSREHIVTWDYYNAQTPKEVREWMSSIAAGNTINVYPKAKHAGWVNHVEFVKVEVYCAWG